MQYKIGSLNCHGFNGITKSGKTIAKIIRGQKFDIVALQEITSVDALVKELNCNNKNGKWKGDCEGEFAFVWNTEKFDLAKSDVRINRPVLFHQYKTDLSDNLNQRLRLMRDPYYARFVKKNGEEFEIRVINTHIRFSKNNELDVDAGEVKLRRNELKILLDLYTKLNEKIYGNKKGLTSYTILIGDYNLNKKNSGAKYSCNIDSPYGISLETYQIPPGKAMETIIFTEQDQLTTLARKSQDSDDIMQSNYSNNYDHVSFGKRTGDNADIEIKSVDAVTKYCGGDFEKYKKEVSDHLPIELTLRIKKK